MPSSPTAAWPPEVTTRVTSVARTVAVIRTSRISAACRVPTRAIAAIASARPTTATAAAVIRTRTDPRRPRTSPRTADAVSAATGGQPIAGAPHGLDGLPPERPVQLVRSRRTYTSTMLGSPSKSASHTCARICRLLSTSPRRRSSTSSSDSSRLVKVSSVAPRQARRPAGSSRRSPADSTTGRSRAPRRSSARNRATSTACENGLVI